MQQVHYVSNIDIQKYTQQRCLHSMYYIDMNTGITEAACPNRKESIRLETILGVTSLSSF